MKKQAHIMHATLYLRMGGLETIIMDLAKNIDRSKFKISILCLSAFDEQYKKELDKIGVHLFHIKRQGKFDFSFFKKIIQFLNSEGVDILHAHSGCFFNTALCAKLSSVRAFIYTEHGLPMNDLGVPFNSSLKARLEDKFAAWVSRKIFAVSQEIKDDMKRRFPRFMTKVDIVTNGVNTDMFKPAVDIEYKKKIKAQFEIDSSKVVIGSVGRLVRIKNYESLIDACSILIHKDKKNIQLMLIGDGPERENLEKCAIDSAILSNVSFAGVQYKIHRLLPVFDIFVLPSWTEGTSISLLEAQASGVPVVVSRVGGNPAIVSDNVNGFLYEAGKATQMADKLNVLITDQYKRERMGTAARDYVEKFYSINKMVSEYEQTYYNILNNIVTKSEKGLFH